MRRSLLWWTPQRLANAVVLIVITYVTLWALHPSLLLQNSLETGGDTGSHVATASYLRDHLSSLTLTSWYPGWFDGFPSYTYYFVLPDLFAALGSYVVGFSVAFKLATILGSLLLPLAAFAMAKLFRARDPIPAALAAATLPFLFDPAFTIDGGNLFSTLAGEYSFSLSLALSLITIGLFARGIRTGRGRWTAAVFLSLTLAAHLVPWLFAIMDIGLLVLLELLGRHGAFDRDRPALRRHDGRRAVWFVVSAGVLSAALSAWWLLPFATSQDYTTSMGYVNDPVSPFHAVFTKLGFFSASGGPGSDFFVICLAAIALLVAFVVRDRLGITVTLSAALALVAFLADPQGALWNERLVPFWFISVYLSAGWLVGWVFGAVGRAIAQRRHDISDDVSARRSRILVGATLSLAVLAPMVVLPGTSTSFGSSFLGVTPGANQVSSWAAWNFSGYQSKGAAWTEYHAIMTMMGRVGHRLGCGQAMWQYDGSESRFGTTMALMLLPYWTNNCVGSMEGLFFESSATTPYHFLNQSELSVSPSNPVVGLQYSSAVNLPLGIEHLQLLGVRYYIAFSPSIIKQADASSQLIPVAHTSTFASSGVSWHVYLIRHSPVVAGVSELPNVVSGISGRESWLQANEKWWLSPSSWTTLLAQDGPSSWPHVTSAAHVRHVPVSAVHVSDVRQGTTTLSFHVDKVGVPVVVKVSYYPRWHVNGGTGPYRVSPNLMVVIPTSKDVTLTYGSSPTVTWGNLVTDVAVVCLVVAAWRRRWWRRPRAIFTRDRGDD